MERGNDQAKSGPTSVTNTFYIVGETRLVSITDAKT
jgi:hypothetical protein